MTEDALLAMVALLGFVIGGLGGYLWGQPSRGPDAEPTRRGTPSTSTPKPSRFTRALSRR